MTSDISLNRLSNVLRVVLAALIAAPPVIWANPSGGHVTNGSATISSSGNTLTVNQMSNTAIINWHDFSINSGELTQFLQPSSISAALNRVTSGDPSSILGTLNANGRVFLINPNGITVGASGVINAQSFVASTLDVPDTEFIGGSTFGFPPESMTFSGNSQAAVSNAGHINGDGGQILLIGHTVTNTGTLVAPSGIVGLAAGSQVTFNPLGSQHLFVEAGGASAATGVDQQGVISAAQAELAAAGGNVYALAINDGGSVNAATTGANPGGRVLVTSDNGNVRVTGNQFASADDGGQITVTGKNIALAGNLETTPGGVQTYNGNVGLIGDVTVTNQGGITTFNGTVNGDHNLAVLGSGNNPGQITFNGAIGNTDPLEAMYIRGETLINGGLVQTNGDQMYFGDGGALFAQPDTTFTSLKGTLAFNTPLNAGNSLTTNSLLSTSFNDQVNIGNALTANITGPDGRIVLTPFLQITSGGDQTYNGNIQIVPVPFTTAFITSVFGNLFFNGTIDGGALSTSSKWNTTFNKPIGSITPLEQLNVDTAPGEINLNAGTVHTTGSQVYGGTVFAQKDTTFTSDSGLLSFLRPLNAAFNLTLNAASMFLGDVVKVGANLVATITQPDPFLQNAIVMNRVSVLSGGDQTYNGDLILRTDAFMNSQFGNLTFNAGIFGTPEGIGSPFLTNLSTNAKWNTTFNGLATHSGVAVGNLSVSVVDGAIHLNNDGIVTSGDQLYNGPIVLGNDENLSTAPGNITFNGTINGDHILGLNAETININAPIGNITPLSELGIFDRTKINMDGGTITTVGLQSYGHAAEGLVSLSTDNTLTSQTADVTINDPIQHNGHTLTIVTPGGTTSSTTP